MSQNQTPGIEHRAVLASNQEGKTSILARRDFNMGASVLGDGLAGSERLAFPESVGIVQFPFFIWHMENLKKKDILMN